MKTPFTLLIALFLITSCQTPHSMIDKTVVTHLDINKYLGQWYELARYDHRFERGMVGVTANYSFSEDGKLKVVNTGYKETLDGEKSVAIGKAKIPNPAVPAKLKVSFFWIFYGDYFVLELDKDYQWAVIGSSSDQYLWILSRTPQMDEATYNELLNRVTTRGYDVSKLIRVEQKNH